MTVENDLINRYWNIIKGNSVSPYFLNKAEQTKSIIVKINELKKVNPQTLTRRYKRGVNSKLIFNKKINKTHE